MSKDLVVYSYSIYTGISHVNQFIKLRPAFIRQITEQLDRAALRYGGRAVAKGEYLFLPSLGETARKTAEAASAMHRILMENANELLGVTVIISGGELEEQADSSLFPDQLLFRVSEEDGLWVDPAVLDDFQEYLEGEREGRLFRVRAFKESGTRLEDRLPKLLVRPERLRVLRRSLESLERDEDGRSVLLIRGCSGSGKRQTLKAALRQLYPDDGGAPLTLFFSTRSEDPLEPFLRSLEQSQPTVSEYLDEEETIWWEKEAASYLESCRTHGVWNSSRDQAALDLVQAFTLYLKAHVRRRQEASRPAYLVIDGFTSESDSLLWLRSFLNEFQNDEGFRLIIIRDSDDFDEILPIPGRGHEVSFRKPSIEEWKSIVAEEGMGWEPTIEQIVALGDSCGANLYRLFHALLSDDKGLDSGSDPGETLVVSLDSETRRLLFLVYAADGLADREILVSRYGESEETMFREMARYDGLVDFGLIREDSDGRVHVLPEGPQVIRSESEENLREAGAFGDYLYHRLDEGRPTDLFRLYRYLETWGPSHRAIAVLKTLFDILLTNRRLRATGRLLTGSLMSEADLSGSDMEALQNVISAARLRYTLLTGDADDVRELVRNGTVSIVGTRGTFSDRFRLQTARYSYALGRYEDALSASKEALFSFQKSGDHQGETHAHVELALSLLALGKVRDALEHFGITRRIGIQVSASWGVLRASALETVTQYLFGNLSRAARDGREYRESAQREGRRDLWLLINLVLVRIAYDLGQYSTAVALAEEGSQIAGFYGLMDEERVMRNWIGRAMVAGNKKSVGMSLLKDASGFDSEDFQSNEFIDREACAFLAEIAYNDGNIKTARRYISRAASLKRKSVRLQGEVDDWSDGFFPIEGRLNDFRGEPVDALGDWIQAFDAFLAAKDGNPDRVDKLSSILENETTRNPIPFSYHYNLWVALVTPDTQTEQQTRCIGRAFNALQSRAGRFDDNQTKHAWLSNNPWNKLLMDEAQYRKFV